MLPAPGRQLCYVRLVHCQIGAGTDDTICVRHNRIADSRTRDGWEISRIHDVNPFQSGGSTEHAGRVDGVKMCVCSANKIGTRVCLAETIADPNPLGSRFYFAKLVGVKMLDRRNFMKLIALATLLLPVRRATANSCEQVSLCTKNGWILRQDDV